MNTVPLCSRRKWIGLFFVLLLFSCLFAACPAMAEETGEAAVPVNRFYMTPWALLPAIIAITLALITKEVYSSLFVGIVMGGMLYSNFSFEER